MSQQIIVETCPDALMCIRELVRIAQKAQSFNCSPVDIKEQLSWQPTEMLEKIEEDINRIIDGK